MSNNDRKIRIRLDITIPMDGGNVEIESDTPPRPTALGEPATVGPQRSRQASILAISHPYVNEEYPVKRMGCGTTGEICAYGHAPTISIGNYPTHVQGSCGGTTVTTAVSPYDGYWRLDAIPGAQCSAYPPYPQNLLTIEYFENSTPVLTPETRTFMGVCSNRTYCESPSTATAKPVQARCYLPVRYLVTASGFSKELSTLTGEWPLSIVPTTNDSAEVVWRAEDSESGVSIELVGDLEQNAATLIFKHHASELRYFKRAGDWSPMNIAHFNDCSCIAAPPGASVPAIVMVSPE
jgi:hypothetical protein